MRPNWGGERRYEGGRWLPFNWYAIPVTRTLLSHLGDDAAAERRRLATERLTSLTDREREVATAVGSGASNAEVAASLYMSEATVKAHVSRLLTKLGATNRVQIAILVHDAES